MPVYVRYPKEMMFEFKLDPSNEEMIYLPYLRIAYRERTHTYIKETNSMAEVEFGTYYIADTTKFWESAMGIFYTLLAITLLIIIIKMVVLTSRPKINDVQNEECRDAIINLIVFIFDFFSTIYFWYLWFMIGYWWVFFKLQERVYTFVPTHETYWENFEQYDWLFGWVTGTKLVYMLFKVFFDQSTFDVYLIDWERRKPQTNDVPIFTNNRTWAGREQTELKDVNAWRQLFLVNELNEIGSYRLINSSISLFIYALVMEGFGIRYWTNEDPSLG